MPMTEIWSVPRLTSYLTVQMEYVIRLSSHLPANSLTRLKLTIQQVDQLWNTLQHPPMSLLGAEHRFRQPDGGNNNPMAPNLGRAGTSYARTVKPMTLMPKSVPDPGVVFDSVMCRREYRPHPNNVSSMLFYIASIIIHGKGELLLTLWGQLITNWKLQIFSEQTVLM